MAQQRCNPEEAFAVLVRTSQRRNTKLRDLAQSVAASTSEAAPDTTRVSHAGPVRR